MSEAVNPPTGPITGVFSAQVEGRPVIFGVQGQTAQSLLTLDPADFSLTAHSADLGAFLSPDGSRVAYVVTDSNQQNLAVQVYNLGDHQTTELIRYNGSDRLSCFIWKPDGSALGFMRTTPAQDETQPYLCQIWTVPTGGGDATKIYGDDLLQFLGWSADGQRIHLTRRLKGLFAYSIFDLGSGQFQDVLLPSDFEQNKSLNIIALTYGLTPEQPRLAYVLNASPYLQNCDSTPLRVVDAQTGQPTSQVRTDGAAISLTFSPDLTMLAFATYNFPDGTGTPPESDSDPTEALSGVSVLSLTDSSLRPLLTPQAGVGQYRLLAWAGDNSGLFVGSADGSVQFVDFQGSTSQVVAPGAEDAGVSNAVVNLDIPYIHQVKMTPDSFDGNWACGPATATMIAAYYGKLTPRQDVFMANPTQYGWYVANPFKSNATGFSFDRTEKDASGHPAAGAYGQVVENGEGYAWRIVEYLTKLGLIAKFRPNVALNVIKDYLNDGKPIVLSTNLHGFGHLVCLKGYTLDGRWIVNDSYWGKPGAGQVVYRWSDFQGPPWMITIDDLPPTT